MTATLDLTAEFTSIFDQEVAELVEKSGVQPEQWRRAGRVSKANPNKEDLDWWRANGAAFVQGYAAWRANTDWNIWEPIPGNPAIELELNCSFGDVAVKTIIDRIFVTPAGELVVVDIKTGANMPKDQGLQLGFYASAVEQVFGVRPAWGAYWNARTGGLSEPYYVDRFTPTFLGKVLGMFVKARNQQLFLPSLGMGCGTCGVRDFCAAAGGSQAAQFDPLLKETHA